MGKENIVVGLLVFTIKGMDSIHKLNLSLSEFFSQRLEHPCSIHKEQRGIYPKQTLKYISHDCHPASLNRHRSACQKTVPIKPETPSSGSPGPVKTRAGRPVSKTLVSVA